MLKEWKKSVKGSGYNFNIKKNEWRISISRDRRSFISQAKNHFGYLLITHHTRGYNADSFDSTEAFGFILKYWEIFAKEHDFLGVFIGSSGDMVKEAAKYTSYQNIEKILEKRPEKDRMLLHRYKKYYCDFENTHMLNLKDDRVDFLIDSTIGLLGFLDDLKKTNEVITFDLTWSTVFPANFFTDINLYYNGARKYIHFTMSEAHITCRIKDARTDKVSEFSFQTAKELKEKIEQEFLKIQQQQKIRNLYDPPKTIFDRKMKYNLGLSIENGDLFYEKLKNYYEPQQIEKKMSDNPQVEKLFSYKVDKTVDEIKIFKIITHYFIFNANTKEIVEAEDYKEAMEKTENLIMDSYQKYIKKKLNAEKEKLC